MAGRTRLEPATSDVTHRLRKKPCGRGKPTGRPQQRGDYVELVFDRPRSIVRIAMEMAFPYGEFARHFEISASHGAETWPVRSRADPSYSATPFQLHESLRGCPPSWRGV